MSYQVTIHDQLSLAQLQHLDATGAYVIKTPHVGNQYLNNLAIAQLGIPMLMVDSTIGHKDGNFHPHRVVMRHASEEIASPFRLTTHNTAHSGSELAKGWFDSGSSVVDVHMQSLKRAIPNAQAMTYSQFLTGRKQEVVQILEVAIGTHPDLWYRWVNSNGDITVVPRQFWRGMTGGRDRRERMPVVDILNTGVSGVTASDGWLIPNVVAILLDGVLAALETGVARAYSLSGPDMVRYIGREQSTLDRLYAALRAEPRFGHLPETFEYIVVPVADMRFVVPATNRSALNDLLLAYWEFQNSRQSRGHVMRSLAKEYHRDAIPNLDAIEKSARERLRDVAAACGEIFYDIRSGQYVSQYDLLTIGTGVYVHPWAVQTPLNEVSRAWKEISRLVA